jgi:hypothetical protein
MCFKNCKICCKYSENPKKKNKRFLSNKFFGVQTEQTKLGKYSVRMLYICICMYLCMYMYVGTQYRHYNNCNSTHTTHKLGVTNNSQKCTHPMTIILDPKEEVSSQLWVFFVFPSPIKMQSLDSFFQQVW